MNKTSLTVLVLCVSLTGPAAPPPDRGLVAHYSFEKGSGTTVRDDSGQSNAGTIRGDAERVRGSYGTALALDGQDDFVDCGATPGLDIAKQGTISVWCRPSTLQGGLVNWSTGGGWTDERLVLAFNTYRGGNDVLGCFADGKGHRQFEGFGLLQVGQWTHLAFAFDGRSVRVYRDGLLNNAATQRVVPVISDVPLWLGRCLGLGTEHFHGLIDEVRIYNRPLSSRELLLVYKQDAAARGKDMSLFRKPGLEASAYREGAKLMLTIDVRRMAPLPQGTRVRAALQTPGAGTVLRSKDTGELPEMGKVQLFLDLQDIAPGQYTARATVAGPGGESIGDAAEAAVQWEGPSPEFKGVRVLNNLVWELLDVTIAPTTAAQAEYEFTAPRDRWVLIRTSARTGGQDRVSVWLDADPPSNAATVHRGDGGPDTLEAMRFLRAGRHVARVGVEGNGRLQRLVVRAVPALQHAFYGANPHVHPYGPYDWEFLRKDVLPNVNVMISGGGAEPPHLKEWTDSGRSWITIIGLPRPLTVDAAGIEKAYQHWSGALGLQHPLMDGIIIDEFGGGDGPIYDVYRQAIERIYAEPKFAGKGFSPYGGTFYGEDRSREFAKAAVKGGGAICWERYLPEQPTEEEARAFIKRRVVDEMLRWEKGLPGAAANMVLVYGYMSQPTESLNAEPGVDFKVYMDMQIRTLATHPAFFGLGGIQQYHSSYCDEENVRWAGRLYRHYCIEGHTEPLTSDPYRLRHIRNADFRDGVQGWSVKAAEPGSIRPHRYDGYSWLEGRYPRTTAGDTFLLMKRSGQRPNSVAQDIVGLEPGRLYSMKMISGDYQDLVGEISNKATHAITIELENAEVLTGPKQHFRFVFPNCYSHVLGKFDRHHNYWMNYWWRVFRAKAETARLTVSDWAGAAEPGGPVGQELMLNFIEIQPYLGE